MSSVVQRKLTTILAADAQGYSHVMEADEMRALDSLRAARNVFSKFIDRHNGRIANTAGDGLLAEFPSVVEAVQCAIEVQQELGGPQRLATADLPFRIGIHLGDVVIDGDDLLGEGVNLAARLQSMAEPGGILISQQVYDQVHAKLAVGFEYLGEKRPKNYSAEIPVYAISRGDDRKQHTRGNSPASNRSFSMSAKTPRLSGDLRARAARHAKLGGAVFAALLVMDLATGPPLWAHFAGIALATILMLEAAPLLAGGWLNALFLRGVALVAGLGLINIFTWSGYPWALWPLGVLVFAEAIRRLGVWSR